MTYFSPDFISAHVFVTQLYHFENQCLSTNLRPYKKEDIPVL
nr:MAG TPA: hypothetical protein [Caudoviricetes sp.]